MKRITSISVATLTVFALTMVLGTSTAHATHYRGGLMTWISGNTPPGPPITFPDPTDPTIDIELVSLSLTSADPVVVPLPESSSGETFQIDSFFDVFTELRIDGQSFTVDSFFDITYRVTPGNTTGSWDTEMVSMQLSGQAAPGGPPVILIRSPALPSPGEIVVTDLPGGDFQVDSFFDIFTEISIDGGPFIPASGPMRLNLAGNIIPEPATLTLLLSSLGLLALRRQRR